MPSQMNEFVAYLRSTVLRQDEAGLTDGQLLQRFIDQRDEVAVAPLVRRHGPMVWGVCRRVLGNHHDAEDAFQATFLVLVRKAASIRQREAVGNWLYGVAHQTALKARTVLAKRRARESQVTIMPESATEQRDFRRDLEPLLDQELSRLPEKYRTAIVLCDLQGKTRKEAAMQLGVPEGTIAARLARARAMLARRLARQGLAVSGATLLEVLSQNAASASVPAALMSSTIKAVTLVASGQAMAAGVVSAEVAAITEGVMKAMFLNKLKLPAAAILALTFICVAAGRFFPPLVGAQQSPAESRKSNETGNGSTTADAGQDRTIELLKQERKKFTGTWKLVAGEAGGEKVSEREIAEGILAKMKWLADNEGRRREIPTGKVSLFMVYNADGNWEQRVDSDPPFAYLNCKGTSKIDPAKNPMSIELKVTSVPAGHELARKEDDGADKPGQTKHVIYEFVNADTYRVCFAAHGKERPEKFSASPESGQRIMVYQRVKDARPK